MKNVAISEETLSWKATGGYGSRSIKAIERYSNICCVCHEVALLVKMRKIEQLPARLSPSNRELVDHSEHLERCILTYRGFYYTFTNGIGEDSICSTTNNERLLLNEYKNKTKPVHRPD